MASNNSFNFLKGGGKMGKLIRSTDWSLTPVGDPSTWPVSLRISVGNMLASPFPTYIAWGKEYIQLYNDGYRPILGSLKHPAALGISTRETFAEIWHIIGSMFAEVMEGKAVGFPNFMLPLNRNGFVEECFFDFSYSPIKDESGKVGGVLVTVIEITEKVTALKVLNDLKAQLERSNAQIAFERNDLNNIFVQAPAGICILSGADLVYEFINPFYQQFFPGRNLFGKPLLEAVPEIKDQPIWDIIQYVYTSGETFEGNELLIPLAKGNDSPVEDRYFNFIYKARKNLTGQIDGILVFVIEVTETVKAKKELQQALEQVRLSKEAAQLGTFDMDLEKGTLHWDERCRILFGISHHDQVSYEHHFVEGLHPDDRERVLKVIDDAFIKEISDGDYDVECRTVGFEDKKVRWMRAKGKVYFDSNGTPLRFIGSALDITEEKLDELRKNDFIGMVSHELRTPLTTLTALVQVTKSKLKDAEDPFLKGAMEKADAQVRKMGSMISGFLNISRLEAGKSLIAKQEFLIDQLVQEIIEEYRLTSASHSIRLSPCDPVKVCADRDKIGSVISNLISNAIKYSPKGNEIKLKCQVLADKVQVSVKDEGMGIKPKDIERLFDRYYRVESKHTAHIAGFGIGLYLSAEIVRQHKGQIWVESEIGIGSTFYFAIPIQ